MMLRHFALASVLLIASSSAPAMAGTTTGVLAVGASVLAACIITPTPLVFGNYTASANNDATTTVLTVCTPGVSPKVTFGQGANADTSSTDAAPLRRLKFGSNYLNYNLYMDANHGNIWGNTDATSEAISATGLAQTTTIYGRIPSGQTTAPIGVYADTVVATITY